MMDQPAEGDAEQEVLLSFFYMCPVGILQIDGKGAVQLLNPMAAQLLMPVGRTPVIGNLFDTLERCAPDLRNLVSSYAQLRGRICSSRRLLVDNPGDDARSLSCTMLKTSADCIMVMLDDVTEQVANERRLKQADSWMAAIISNVNDFACFSLDVDGFINSWNQSGVKQTGFTAEDALGGTLDLFRAASERVPGQMLDHLDTARREGWHLHEDRCHTGKGESFWCQILITALKEDNGQIPGFSVVLRDVTERKMTSDELRRLLTTDHLTGAANRSRFFEMAAVELALWQRYGRPMSLIMLDADHFKQVNDTFGHAAGDVVLRAFVACSKLMLRSVDLLARFGGEEFIVLLPGTDASGAADLAWRICKAIAVEPIAYESTLIPLTVSIGCASMGAEIQTLDELLKAADTALYRAKKLGRNRVCSHTPAASAIAPDAGLVMNAGDANVT
jgi:diguanylate cyclase (GGDEF)-like protein/PAS domain S-box-containing protein